ncbi:Uncharacterised protein [Yersinia bercovieri]|nr:Uncharacterised protein [Yersinia bercovieri]
MSGTPLRSEQQISLFSQINPPARLLMGPGLITAAVKNYRSKNLSLSRQAGNASR